MANGCTESNILYNIYSADVSVSSDGSPTPLGELRSGDIFYVFVYSNRSTPNDVDYIQNRNYTIILQGATIVSNSQSCASSNARSLSCSPPTYHHFGRQLINIITAQVDAEFLPNQAFVVVSGSSTNTLGYYSSHFLEAKFPVQRGQIEVTYLGGPLPNSARVELTAGLNPFEVRNISPQAIQIRANDPQISLNPAISLEMGFPGGVVILNPGDSAPFVLRCNDRGEPNLRGALDIYNTSSIPFYTLNLLCEPSPLPALGNQPSDGGGDITINTAEPPMAPPLGDPPPVDCQANPFDPNC